MGKRRHQDLSEEDIKRKIAKLERKLSKNRRKRVIQSSSDEETNYIDATLGQEPATRLHNESPPMLLEPVTCPSPPLSPVHPPSLYPVTEDTYPEPQPPPPSQQPSTQVPSTSNPPAEDPSFEEVELDADILELLGDAPKIETPLGPAIHKDVANRWREILLKGLTKEVKEKLLKEYLVPNNCDVLLAPTLNPEAKAALPESLVKRDSSLMYKQKQLGIALSALAMATELILSNETSKQKILKPISDACRLLCDRHFIETRTRRDFVISSINNTLKDVLLQSARDNFLFGENLGEKLKAAKSIQRTGETLKNITQKPIFQKSNFVNKSNKGRLNFKPLHRKTDNKMNSEPSRVLQPSTRPPPPPPRPLHKGAERFAQRQTRRR